MEAPKKKRVVLNLNGYIKGQIVDYMGEPHVFDGTQLKKVCKSLDCKRPAIFEGECKSHSEHWRCKYTASYCDHIRTVGDYCQTHRNNVFNSKIKSKKKPNVGTDLT